MAAVRWRRPGARESGSSLPCRAGAAVSDKRRPAAPTARSASDIGGAASLARNWARLPVSISGDRRRRFCVPDAAIRLLDHLDHALLDETPGLFEPGFVEISGNLDRLAPQIHAASEGQGEMKAVPGREHSAAACCIGDG